MQCNSDTIVRLRASQARQSCNQSRNVNRVNRSWVNRIVNQADPIHRRLTIRLTGAGTALCVGRAAGCAGMGGGGGRAIDWGGPRRKPRFCSSPLLDFIHDFNNLPVG